MRNVNILLAVLVSLLMGLGVLEGGLRLMGFGKPESILRFDPDLGWSNEPGRVVRRSTSEFEVTLEVNDLGLREDPMKGPGKPANTYRVLCLGDSFTLGFCVEREDLYVDLLEDWWNQERRRVDVVNAGTEGWSTDQEVAWLLKHGEAYAPDLVLLFPYENDVYWNGQGNYMGMPKPLFAPLEPSGSEARLEERELVDPGKPSWLGSLALARCFSPKKGAEHRFEPEGGGKPLLKEFGVLLDEPPPFIESAVAHTRAALVAAREQCNRLGARLIVVPIPSHGAVDSEYAAAFGERVLALPADAWSASRPSELFLSLASELGLDVLDPREFLSSRIAQGEDLYFERDWHLNATGNRALATFLHDELDRGDFFPAAHGPIAEGRLAPPTETAGLPGWVMVWIVLWGALSLLYVLSWRDEPVWRAALQVAALLAAVFAIILGGEALVDALPPTAAQVLITLFVLGVLVFVVVKLGHRTATIIELLRSFTLRGHWYLMPLVVVLLTVGSLLVVAASSPFVAPFIYTLF